MKCTEQTTAMRYCINALMHYYIITGIFGRQALPLSKPEENPM
jgi:hypothetical protein